MNFLDTIFEKIVFFNDVILWGYLGFGLILTSIIYLNFKSKFMPLTQFPAILRYFISCAREKKTDEIGVSSMRAFFAGLGGCIGIGNLAAVGVAIQLGGPGALFWVCIVSFLGSIVKYAEMMLALKYREPYKHGYDGGPMYFLPRAFPKFKKISILVSILLGIYGVDVYMFTVIKTSFSTNLHIPDIIAYLGLLALVLLGVKEGISRVGAIGSVLLPAFLIMYVGMSIWIIKESPVNMLSLLKTILASAFTGHAALGAFAGSSFLLMISKSISTSVYASDIGVGYASILQSETRSRDITKQASLSIMGVFLNTFVICLCSMLLVLVTGVWTEPISDGGMLVQAALSKSFENMPYFMPFFLFAIGYTSLISSFLSGIKCARFVKGKGGVKFYYVYGALAFTLFSYFSSYYALIIMTLVGGMLTLINLSGILKLRKEIDFEL